MVRLRRGQYLVCFYCGKRTSLRFDGATRQFDCSKCEATNYLDENGEITDPPVATERESTPRQFAVPQAASAATPHHIFCDRCIKNQRLFTASLAQYLPSDPSDPDYERLEKEYYRFRRNLETRYPQVCADCEGKVRGAIKQASYAARTDHLRRMVERTRNIRQGGSSAKTTLDWVDLAGKALWWGGLLVQMLWHFKLIVHILQIPDPDGGMRDPDAGNPIGDAAAKLQPLADKLPGVALLLKVSLVSGILSAWWNPQFVKVARGFTRHLLGFTQWYSFQGLIVFFRFVYSSVAEVVDGQTQSAQLSAHLIMAVFMIMMYNFARRSIKVNTAPLFGPSDGTASPKQPPSPVRNNQPRNIKSFAEELDEALVSAASSPVKPPAPSAQYTAPQSRDGPFQRRTPAPNRDFNLRPTSAPRSPGMNGLSLSDTPERSAPQSDEMDWSPTVPPPPMPRAFQPSSKPGTRAFGASPTTSENSPFWYKVPAAPVNPAHKLRNPPNAPMIRPNLSADKNGFGNGNGKKGDIFFRGAASKAKREEDEEQRRRGVEFRHQSFFAERKDDGDANSLADMLGASFSIESEAGDAQSVVDEPFHGQQNAAASQSARPTSAPAPARAPTWEFALLNALLAVYLISSFVDLPYHANVQVVALCLGGILALRIMGREQTVSPLRSALGVAELACLCTVGWNTWIGEEGGEDDLNSWMGVGAFAAMVVHQGIDLMTTR